ncbi:hypothetical protein AQUCO_03000384v1 [Aquilegia coerulea]|uniref:Uncharacterized protein n=1 Tax=Aquilegia coerulea TaxID=218851 RepID=A0A2G5D3M7_AQUCA|nr:hypothetical protein AQUCO_03000384v1 [Aquilegia coerulea]
MVVIIYRMFWIKLYNEVKFFCFSTFFVRSFFSTQKSPNGYYPCFFSLHSSLLVPYKLNVCEFSPLLRF